MDSVERAMLAISEDLNLSGEFFLLTEPTTLWGDYGSQLINGNDVWNGWEVDHLAIERAGPYVPPITFPGHGRTVVTDGARSVLESWGDSGFTFKPVIKQRIVRVDWHIWDLSDEDGYDVPEDGEPEGMLDGEHDEELARSMPEMWWWQVSQGCRTIDVKLGEGYYDKQCRIEAGSWSGRDIFSDQTGSKIYVTANGREWLKQHFPAWVSFQRILKAEPA